MKRRIALAALAGTLLISNMNVFAETDQKDTMFSDGVNQLASEIYGEMDAEGNVFFSPYSISVALSMPVSYTHLSDDLHRKKAKRQNKIVVYRKEKPVIISKEHGRNRRYRRIL